MIIKRGAAVVAAALLAGCGAAVQMNTQSYDVTERAAAVRVTSGGGTVDIVGSDRTTIRVTENLEYSGDKPTTSHTVTNGELVLSSTCPKMQLKCNVGYRVEVPRATAAHVETGGGNVTIKDLAGTIGAKSGGGTVVIDGTTAKQVTARTDGGNTTVRFNAPPELVDATSGGGNVTVRLPSGSYAVDASTGGGIRKVEVPTDPASPHKIKARSDGGNVTVGPL